MNSDGVRAALRYLADFEAGRSFGEGDVRLIRVLNELAAIRDRIRTC
jgi:hypothetical protein